ncbi:hypothetical protein GUITHDRAFT_115001 [Guillardia theta CCMP2712]|uniref:Uncharacterized protein n=1 Tax=Guillardia theta (strain CCMP2712) TaxID=905079 RepID=L1IRK3_GUITC|nr:hypothetical protein GUITHDRAFT_115001 [Guillardia theta CCMP2712]EKX38896.1 hypothetical protein GUITHDRAFT_115001 [Guillardia theta CCMP2712]|eukprot:XP_005825876.1 hypothetical protein GUITHDRAFT_115001 [Guillardia theta CCMP2712]
MGRKKSSKAKGGGGGGGAAAAEAGDDQAVQREDETQEQVQLEAEKQVEEGAREEKVAEPVNATSSPEDNNVHPDEEQDKVKAGDDSAHKYLSLYSLEQLLKSTDALPSLNELRPSLDSDGYIKPVPMQADEDEGSDSQSQPRSEVPARALSGGANGGAASEFLKVKAKIDLVANDDKRVQRTGLDIPEECDPGIPNHQKEAAQGADSKSSQTPAEALVEPSQGGEAVNKNMAQTAPVNKTSQVDDRQRAAIPPSDDDLVTDICASTDEPTFKPFKAPSDMEISSTEAWTTAAFLAVGTVSLLWVTLRLTVLKRS